MYKRQKQRQSDDNQRYKELYGIDMADMAPYTLIVDADDIDADEVFRLVSNELGG